MAYTIEQIKVLAYSFDKREDFSISEANLFTGLAFAYEWYRDDPEAKEDCQRLANEYIEIYEREQKGDLSHIGRSRNIHGN